MSEPGPSSPSRRPTELTKSALDAHNRATSGSDIVRLPPADKASPPGAKRPRHRIILPTAPLPTPGALMNSRHWATPSGHTPTRNPSSYFAMTPSVASSKTVKPPPAPKPTLTTSQSRAHALGYSPTSDKYFPLPSPPKSSLPPPVAPTPRQDASAFQRLALQTIAESSSNGSSRSGSDVKPPSVSISQRRRHRSNPPTDRVPDLSTSPTAFRIPLTPGVKSPHPYFSWTPGAVPPPIFDPDYPEGSPICLSPRLKGTPSSPARPKAKGYFDRPTDHPPLPIKVSSSDPSSSNYTEAPLTMSELSLIHSHVGTVQSVFGKLPDISRTGQPAPRSIPWLEMQQHFARVKKERPMDRRSRRSATTLPSTSGSNTDAGHTDDSSVSPPTSEELAKGDAHPDDHAVRDAG